LIARVWVVSRTSQSEENMSQARWFVGVLVVRSRVNDGTASAPLVDLQYRVIHAVDLEAATRARLSWAARLASRTGTRQAQR
jgi:hypothetical protein